VSPMLTLPSRKGLDADRFLPREQDQSLRVVRSIPGNY
jgi:hypothetical protein